VPVDGGQSLAHLPQPNVAWRALRQLSRLEAAPVIADDHPQPLVGPVYSDRHLCGAGVPGDVRQRAGHVLTTLDLPLLYQFAPLMKMKKIIGMVDMR
jgi:hypothetical protein